MKYHSAYIMLTKFTKTHECSNKNMEKGGFSNALQGINSCRVPIYYTPGLRETIVDKMHCLKAYTPSVIRTHDPLITSREHEPTHKLSYYILLLKKFNSQGALELAHSVIKFSLHLSRTRVRRQNCVKGQMDQAWRLMGIRLQGPIIWGSRNSPSTHPPTEGIGLKNNQLYSTHFQARKPHKNTNTFWRRSFPMH